MAVRELVRLLDVPSAARPALRKRLRAMAEEGALVRVRGRYSTAGFPLHLPGNLSGPQAGVWVRRSEPGAG